MKKVLVSFVLALSVAAAQQVPATALPFVPSVDLPRGAYFAPTEDCDKAYAIVMKGQETGDYACLFLTSDPSSTLSIIKSYLALAGYALQDEQADTATLVQLFNAPDGGFFFLVYLFSGSDDTILLLVVRDVVID